MEAHLVTWRAVFGKCANDIRKALNVYVESTKYLTMQKTLTEDLK